MVRARHHLGWWSILYWIPSAEELRTRDARRATPGDAHAWQVGNWGQHHPQPERCGRAWGDEVEGRAGGLTKHASLVSSDSRKMVFDVSVAGEMVFVNPPAWFCRQMVTLFMVSADRHLRPAQSAMGFAFHKLPIHRHEMSPPRNSLGRSHPWRARSVRPFSLLPTEWPSTADRISGRYHANHYLVVFFAAFLAAFFFGEAVFLAAFLAAFFVAMVSTPSLLGVHYCATLAARTPRHRKSQ